MVFNVGEVLEATVNSLKAGKVYLIQKQTYSDEIKGHLKRLNPDDRHLRFGTSITDDRIDHYVDDAVKIDDFLFGVFGNDGSIVAFLHMARDARDKNAFELGLSVDSEFRGEGYASAMFEKAVTFAKTLGAKRIFTYCLAENKAMQSLAKKHDLRVMLEYGDVTGELELPQRSSVEIVNNLVDFATTEQMMIFDKMSYNMVHTMLNQFNAFEIASKSFAKLLRTF